MSSDSENDESYVAPDILEGTKVTSINLLPEKSKKKYDLVYKAFMDWRSLKKDEPICENVLLAYFEELSEKYKSSSLWAHYSMLKSTLIINNNINIKDYVKLCAFLKCKSEGYRPKKAKTFTPDEINRFIYEASDTIYLVTKVALIMGIMGGCRANELYSMNIEDFEDLGSALLVTIPNTNPKLFRKFTLTGRFYEIYKKYSDLRPVGVGTSSFFLNYQKGKCTVQKIGINKFGAMGKQIATYLKLQNPEIYTAHSFRRSFATLLAGGDITVMKRHDATLVSSGYIDDSMKNKTNTPNHIVQSMQQKRINTPKQNVSTTNETISFDINSTPSVNFTNCSNITINFVTNKSNKSK